MDIQMCKYCKYWGVSLAAVRKRTSQLAGKKESGSKIEAHFCQMSRKCKNSIFPIDISGRLISSYAGFYSAPEFSCVFRVVSRPKGLYLKKL
jgi:hypothetical protein